MRNVSTFWRISLQNIKNNPFWKSKFNIFAFLNSLLLNLCIWIILYIKLKPSDYPIPLHFNVYFGIDVIDKWSYAFVIPGLGLFLSLLNFFISYLVFKRAKFLSYFLNINSNFVQILLFLGSIGLIIIQHT